MDQFTITVPPERQFAAVPGLVLGGIAARHELTLDALDDLQLAIESLLPRASDGDEVTIVLLVDGASGIISASVGPLAAVTAGELEREADETLGLRRLLDAVVDGMTLRERDGATWVELRKKFELEGIEAGR
jgi:hypothetical protein